LSGKIDKLERRIAELECELAAAKGAARDARGERNILRAVVSIMMNGGKQTRCMFTSRALRAARAAVAPDVKLGKESFDPDERRDLIRQEIAAQRAESTLILPGATPLDLVDESSEEGKRAAEAVDNAIVVTLVPLCPGGFWTTTAPDLGKCERCGQEGPADAISRPHPNVLGALPPASDALH
jgi:hypothetical protein